MNEHCPLSIYMSLPRLDSWVYLMRYDPSDLLSMTLIQIIPVERILRLVVQGLK